MKNLTKFWGWLLTIAIIITCSIPAAQAAPKKKQNNKKFVVVIDAGHGGKDVGAYEHGVREKDVNLAVALKAGALIKKKLGNDIEVVYTRDKDVFIPVRERSEIANRQKADLFISVHTNSAAKENSNRAKAHGASVYTLGPRKDGHDKDSVNMEVARRENSVIAFEGNSQSYQGFDPDKDESYIIFEMAQKDNRLKSIKLANDIQKYLVKDAGRTNRGVMQDTFWLLWATSMPSVLIELDFVCNPDMASFLGSNEGQDKLANAIYHGVKDYYTDHKKLSAHQAEEPTETEADDFVADAMIAVSQADRQVSAAPTISNARATDSTVRKRRNSTSRQISAERNIDQAVIMAPVTNTEIAATNHSAPVVETKPEPPKESKKETKKESKKEQPKAENVKQEQPKQVENLQAHVTPDKTAKARERKHTDATPTPVDEPKPQITEIAKVEVKPEPQTKPKEVSKPEVHQEKPKEAEKRTAGSPVRPKLNTYYSIKLFESAEQVKENDELLQGLAEKVHEHRQDGKYIYTLGHYAERQDTVPVIDSVKDRFPQAKAVRINSGTNKIIQ